MSYAPHTNTQVQWQLKAGIVPTDLPMIFGCFREVEWDHLFEYAERRWANDNFAPEFPHIIYTGPDGQTRLAKVMKTVAYVVTGEDGAGNPVVEKWAIKSHRIYDTSWVR